MKILKKIGVMSILFASMFSLVGCEKETEKEENSEEVRELTSLKNNEVLVVGSESFSNYVDVNTTISVITYTKEIVYSLYRTSYDRTNSVNYNGYYYSWESNRVEDELLLGSKRQTTEYTYKYLAYEDNQKILVKSVVKTSYKYSYTGGWKVIDPKYTFDLNGYFESTDDLMEKCPLLMQQINTSETYRYYVDTNTPEYISNNKNTYTTYYYIQIVK